MKIKGISPIADHWRDRAEKAERALARRDALLRNVLQTPIGLTHPDLKRIIERELGDSHE